MMVSCFLSLPGFRYIAISFFFPSIQVKAEKPLERLLCKNACMCELYLTGERVVLAGRSLLLIWWLLTYRC